MASVYEAIHEPSGQRSAVKVLHQMFAQNQEVLNRFFNEAKAANAVEHPAIVRIHECGMTLSGVAYLAMEYIDGANLHERLYHVGGILPEITAIQITQQIASALSAAHEKGIVHRDLKPENVMLVLEGGRLGEVRVKILDFGIAKLAMGLGMSGGLPTRTGVLMGTPTYMAPEQCRGARGVDDKADVYALGVMFYQMLSGAPPFASQGAAEVMAQHVHEPPPPLLARAPQVSVKLAEFVEQMLSKQPTARPSMTAVEAWLAAMSATQGHRSEAEAGSTVLLGGSGGQSALVRRSSPDMPTQVAEDGNRPALLPANAPTQVASNPVLDAQTKLLPALSPATAETQIQNESVPISEQKTQFDLSQGDDPPTLRPNDAQQASADLRRRAETKLVVISETLFQPPKTSQLYFETARSWLGQAVERLQKHPNRKLFLWLLGAGGMMVLMLLFYALFG